MPTENKNKRIKKTNISIPFMRTFDFWNCTLQTKIRTMKDEADNKKSWKLEYIDDIFSVLCQMATAIKNLKGDFEDK